MCFLFRQVFKGISMVVGGVLYSVIVAAPRTKTVMNAPITSTLQDTVVFLGATSVVCSAGMVLNVAVAMSCVAQRRDGGRPRGESATSI